jgi:hypothetical protein
VGNARDSALSVLHSLVAEGRDHSTAGGRQASETSEQEKFKGEDGMKALSLTQPWASAIALGIKQWETRSWPTSYRGEILIHASKGFPKWAKEFARDECSERRMIFLDPPLGKILCLCELTECRQTDTVVNEISETEREWGDYTPGRFAFKMENVRVLTEPVPARGALGLWIVSPDTLTEVARNLKGK